MAIIKLFQNRKKKDYTDVEYVEGVLKGNRTLTDALYEKCKVYFYNVFSKEFVKEAAEDKDDIFQNSFIKLWENIENGKISVENGVLIGHDKDQFHGSLTTYLMSIANLKYLEVVRKNSPSKKAEIDSKETQNMIKRKPWDFSILYDNDNKEMLEIIAECISHMSERCSQIMTMFYLKEMKLNEIWENLPTYEKYDALKTEKYKCQKRLKECADNIYNH